MLSTVPQEMVVLEKPIQLQVQLLENYLVVFIILEEELVQVHIMVLQLVLVV